MKKIYKMIPLTIALVLGMLVLQIPLSSQWMRSPMAYNVPLDATWLNDDEVILVGSRGLILKSNSSGTTWESVASKTNVELNEVFFLDEENGWIAGNLGTILITQDGGETWNEFSTNTTTDLQSIHFIDTDHGWAGGENGEVYVTANGGFTWSLIANPTFETIQTMFFTDALHGTAAGTNGLLMTTSDGGLNWNIIDSQTFQAFRNVVFINENEGFIGGAFVFRKTTDGGQTWNDLPGFISIFDIHYKNGTLSVLRDGNQISYTSDGGSSWSTASFTSQNSAQFFAYSGNQKYVVNDQSYGVIVSQDNGLTWSGYLAGSFQNHYGMHFTNANEGWIASTGGSVLKTTDGGNTWQQVQTGNFAYFAIRFNGSNGLVGGNGGYMKKTSDGGITWNAVTSGTTQPIYTLAFSNATTVFFGSDNGMVRRSTDAGSSWSTINTGVNYTIRRIFFLDAQNGWLCGHGGIIMRTTDGGSTWSLQSSGTNVNLLSIQFVSASIGFAVGASGTILKTTNGGQNWSPQTSNTSETVMSVDFINSTNGIAVGNAGLLLHTYDGGVTWSAAAFPSPTEYVCNAVQITAPGKAVAVANNGNILLFEEPCGTNTLPQLLNEDNGFIACNGQGTEIFGGATGILEWYDGPNPTTANLLGTGNSFTTPPLVADTTFYVFNTACSDSQNESLNWISFEVTALGSPIFTGYTDGYVCGEGSVTIQGFSDSGTISWYSDNTGGILLGTGNDFVTPVLNSNTLYYAEAFNGCTSEFRMPVMANVNDIPQFVEAYGGVVCDADSSYAYALGDIGETYWYASPTDTVSLGLGSFFVTPILFETTSYFAQLVSDFGCISEEFMEVVVNVYDSPEILQTTASSLCGMGYSDLTAEASAGSIYWLDAPVDGIVVADGGQTISPLITENTTLYAIAVEGACTSEPVAVDIAFYEPITGSVVVNGTTLTASYGNVNYQWFNCITNVPVDGATSASFTPEVTGAYYCIASNEQCSTTSECYDILITGITEHDENMLRVYPNPAQEFIRVDAVAADTYTVYDVDGRIVMQTRIYPGQNIDISNLAQGCYRLVSAGTGTSTSFIKK